MAYNSNATQQVFDFIIGRIESGEWKVGDRIWPEHKICSELTLSRSSVRQAIDKLSMLSIVKKVKGSGTYVKNVDVSAALKPLMPIIQISDQELLSILEFRKYFEPGNLDIFMKNAQERYLIRLRELYEEMLTLQGNPEQFYIADFTFHEVIAEGTGNDFVHRISVLLKDILLSHQRRLYEHVGPSVGIHYHGDILKAIENNDAELAVLFMRRHIEDTYNQSKEIVAKRTGQATDPDLK